MQITQFYGRSIDSQSIYTIKAKRVKVLTQARKHTERRWIRSNDSPEKNPKPSIEFSYYIQ